MMKRRSLALPRKFLLNIYNKNYPSLMRNDIKVQFATSQKHLVLILDFKFDFIEQIDNKINKRNEIIGLMKRQSLTLSRKILLTVYIKDHPSLMLNGNKVQSASNQKHLVQNLDSRLDFIEHIDNKINKWKKIIGLI